MKMSPSDQEYVVIGKLGATYGIKGWLKVNSFTEATEDILSYKPWYIEDKTEWKPFKISAGRPYGKGVIIHIAGFDTPEQARLFTGKKIAIKRSQLPTLLKQEFYWSDLIGLTVVNSQQQTLGIVTSLIETGSNDVLVLKDSNNKEHGVPYLSSVILEVDLEAKIIRVNWDLI